jgi:hypothetical protein
MKPQDKARHLRPLIERAAISLPDEDNDTKEGK